MLVKCPAKHLLHLKKLKTADREQPALSSTTHMT